MHSGDRAGRISLWNRPIEAPRDLRGLAGVTVGAFRRIARDGRNHPSLRRNTGCASAKGQADPRQRRVDRGARAAASIACVEPGRALRCRFADKPTKLVRLPIARVGFRLISKPAQPWVERIVQAIADQIDSEDGDQDRDAGNRAEPPRALQEITRRADHEAPAHHVRIR